MTSLLEDHEGTVWVGTFGSTKVRQVGCARSEAVSAKCDGEMVPSAYLFGVCKKTTQALCGPVPTRDFGDGTRTCKTICTPGMRIDDLIKASDGTLLIGSAEEGLSVLAEGRANLIPFVARMNRGCGFRKRGRFEQTVAGPRWGSLDRNAPTRLIHLHHGRTDVFTKSDGLSGDIICSLFEDHEGNVWVGTTRGIDRFRELPVNTTSIKHGLSDTFSLVAAADGSIWVATHGGLLHWKDGQIAMLPRQMVYQMILCSLCICDHRGRIWAFTGHGLYISRTANSWP